MRVVDLGVTASAVGTPVLWAEDVLRKWEAGLCSSVMPSLVVGTLVRGISRVLASTWTRLLFVVTAPSVEICGARISGLVGKSCFPAVVCTVVESAIRAAVLVGGLGVVMGG